MFLTIIFTALLSDLRPLPFDGLGIDRARHLDGQTITAAFLVGRPTYFLSGHTMAGAVERDDGTEVGAVLLGRRVDVEMGRRVVVRGRLRVLDHPPGFVGDMLVPGWVELRLEEQQ